jgi:phage-related protein
LRLEFCEFIQEDRLGCTEKHGRGRLRNSCIDRHSIIAIYLHISWTVGYLNETVEREIAELPGDMQAKLRRIADMIEQLGLSAMREPYIKHLQGKLWEMRMIGRDGISRAIYVTMSGQRVVIVRVFRKKSQKTPRGEIELALKRAEQLT